MGLITLTIDIGGTGIKLLPVDEEGRSLAERHRELTPKPSTPGAIIGLIAKMLAQQAPFDRVSVGFPGVVKKGIATTAPNLGTDAWRGFNLEKAIIEISGKPTRVVNDADLQGYGVIDGAGVEIVLTLGTGLGTGLYVDGCLVPNLELAHHPLKGKKTYERLVSDATLRRVGERKWRKQVMHVIETLESTFNHDLLHIGGGNATKLQGPLPDNARLFTNVEGLAGGVRLWMSESGAASALTLKPRVED